MAFAAEADDLRLLSEAFEKHVGPVEIQAECADSLTRHFPSVSSLAEYENPPAAQICALRITARSRELSSRAHISLGNASSSNIYIGIEAEEGACVALNTDIGNRLEAMRPWYSPLWRFDFVNVFYIITWVPILLLLGAVGLGMIRLGQSQNSASNADTGRGVLIGIAPVVLGIVVNATRGRLFPIASFLVGQGKKRDRNIELARNLLAIGLVVSILGSLVATWLLTR